MLRPLLILSACSLTALTFAQTKVSIVLSSKKEVGVFENPVWPVKEPSSVTKSNEEKFDFSVNSTRPQDRVFVIDYSKGNVASKTVTETKISPWNLPDGAFNVVYKVVVEVSTPKGPATAASVELTDELNRRTELLDSTSKGRATFYFVKPGEIKATVTYRAEGKMADPVKQSFTLKMDREAVEPVFKVALPDGDSVPSVPVAGSSDQPKGDEPKSESGSKDDSDKKEPKTSGGSAFGNILTVLLGLGFVGVVAYFVLKMMRENPDKVKDTLTKLGADIPKAGPADDPDPVAPIIPITPQPMQQIILDGGAPAPVAPVTPINLSATPATGIPTIIASDGSELTLPEGETVVGREFGNGLVVPNDTVSRRHASIIKSGTNVELQDHGSTNGTWVNGVKVVGSQTLRSGDSVRFGSVEYRYQG